MASLGFTLKQRLRTLAWSSPTALRAATGLVDTAYSLRKRLRPTPAANPTLTPTQAGAGLPATLHRFRTEFQGLGGWLEEGAVVTWDTLLSFQRELGLVGPMLEIGVLKGRSAALMALHATAEETVALADIALQREAVDAVTRAHPGPNLELRGQSSGLVNDLRIASMAETCRWVHIDGEHSGPAVSGDLGVAERLLAPKGLICIDDFFSPAYPQITRAVMTWVERSGGAMQLILSGFNKGYLCRAGAAQLYLAFMRDRLYAELAKRDYTDVTVWKSAAPSDMNCFGLTPRHLGFDYKGNDLDPLRIVI